MISQRQRRTQTAEYWRDEFAVNKEDLDYIYEWFVEEGEPRTTDELILKIMERRCQKEELALSKQGDGQIYLPQEKYDIGQRVVFPAFDYATGQVLAIRDGKNPRYGPFRVIRVQLDNEDSPREFAAEFSADHPLRRNAPSLEDSAGLLTPKQLFETYGANVRERVSDALHKNEEFTYVNGRWFLRGLMPEVTPFQLNIAEAIIDERRRPVEIWHLLEKTDQVLKETGTHVEGKSSARAYALAYALNQDPRFVEIRTVDASSWYLSNSIPDGVRHKPARLVPMHRARGDEWLNRELRDFALELSDEADELVSADVPAPSSVDSVQIFLTYPHRREGTLPLTMRTLGLFSEKLAERFVVTFVDPRSKEEMPGWMLPAEGYAWGLGEWYRRHDLPIGAVVELHRGDDPFTFLVSCEERKRKADWIREAKVSGGRLTFSMQRKAYSCRYDKYLLIDEGKLDELDRLWTNPGDESDSLFDFLTEVFPELAKLSGQGLVHAKTLYSAVNLTRRCGAVPIFTELTRRACFDPVGDGNWVYDEALRNVTYITVDEMSRRPSSRRQDFIVDRVYRYGVNPNED